MVSLSILSRSCLCFWHKLYFFSCTGGVLSLPQKKLNYTAEREKERRWRYEYKVHAYPECCSWCAADRRGHLLLVQSGRGAALGGLLLGIFLLLSGVAEIVVFAAASGVMLGSGWLLLDGILTVIMSLFLLFNQWFTMLSLPFLFTLWLLFSGVSQCVSSFDLRALGVRAWGWILAVGILLTLAGFICLMDPWVSVAAMGMTVGIVFLLEGVSSIVYACISRTKDI